MYCGGLGRSSASFLSACRLISDVKRPVSDVAPRSADSGSTPARPPGPPWPTGRRRSPPRGRRSASSVSPDAPPGFSGARRSPAPTARSAVDRRPADTERLGLALVLRSQGSAGRSLGMPSRMLRRLLLALLATSQRLATSSGVSLTASPKTCGWRPTSLSCSRLGDVGEIEPALFGREHRVEHTWAEVPELLFQMGDRSGARPARSAARSRSRRAPRRTPRADGTERTVGLLGVPRTAAPEGRTSVHQAHDLDATGRPHAGSTPRSGGRARSVLAVELGPLDRHNHLVFEPEVVKEHRRAPLRGEGPPPRASPQRARCGYAACATRSGPALAGGLRGEIRRVDEPDRACHRVRTDPFPHQVHEGHRGHDFERDPIVGSEHLDRALRHQRRAGTTYTTSALRAGRYESFDDPCVDLVEGRGPLVESDRTSRPDRRCRETRCRRMPDGPQENAALHTRWRPRVACQVRDPARRSKPDCDDPAFRAAHRLGFTNAAVKRSG